jgi:hypothetical protein
VCVITVTHLSEVDGEDREITSEGDRREKERALQIVWLHFSRERMNKSMCQIYTVQRFRKCVCICIVCASFTAIAILGKMQASK